MAFAPTPRIAGRNLIVTGAHGFLGRYVAQEAAAAGFVVSGIGHGSWDRNEYRRWGLSEWYGTALNMESLITYAGKADVIIHCAGSGSVAFSIANPYQDFSRNVLTTLDVLEFIRLHRPGCKLVIPSSAGIYGATGPGPIRVTQRAAPVSPYGTHKYMSEDLARSYGTNHGVATAIVRLFSVYGIGLRKQLWWDACRKLSAGGAAFFGTGDETRDWLHVRDAARLLLEAAEHANRHCPTANGGVGIAVPNRSIVEELAKHLGVSGDIAFEGSQRPGDPIHFQADNEEARAWGWAPQHQWEAEVPAYVDWYVSGAP